MGNILVINAGSSSIKFAVFADGLTQILTGSVAEIGGAAWLTVNDSQKMAEARTHAHALTLILFALAEHGLSPDQLSAAGHRVVHGGANLTAPRLLDAATLAEIEACAPLAPLHNPHNLAAIRALAALAPALPQTASFDTGFHATNPPEAQRFALPDTPATQGLRRYGFHGLSYASLCETLPQISGQPLPHRLLAFHLGNGASACGIVNGRSVCTTMGYSPMDGLTMGTRPGSLDPQAVLTLVERIGLEPARTLLNSQSGLYGLSGGTSDMRVLLNDRSEAALFAVSHFIYWAVRHGGAMVTSMGGVDGIAFTGGIGEHAAEIRDSILTALAWLNVPAFVVPAAEERQIARDATALLQPAA